MNDQMISESADHIEVWIEKMKTEVQSQYYLTPNGKEKEIKLKSREWAKQCFKCRESPIVIHTNSISNGWALIF